MKRFFMWMLLALLLMGAAQADEVIAVTCGGYNLSDTMLDGDPSTAFALRSGAKGSIADVILLTDEADISEIWLRTSDSSGLPGVMSKSGVRLTISLYNLDDAANPAVYSYSLQRTDGGIGNPWDQVIRLPRVHWGISVIRLRFESDYGFNGYDTPSALADVSLTGSSHGWDTSTSVYGVLVERLATRTGPSTNYTEPGTFLGAGDRVQVVTKAYDERNGIWWVQVDFEYHDERVRAYTGLKRVNCDIDSVPEESWLGSVWIPREIPNPAYGPGYDYRTFKASVPAGIQCDAIAVENGWVQIEYFDQPRSLYRRVWVPEDQTQGL